MSSRRTRHRRGFTLLELVLAMGIAAILSLVIYGALTAAFRARATALRQTESMREAAIALDIIEGDLNGATPPAADLTNGNPSLFGPFVGDANGGLSFYCLGRQTKTTLGDSASTTQDDPIAEGVRQVTYSLTADSATGKNVLTRSLVRNLLATSTATAEDEQLLPDVATLTFEYYDGSQWTDTWDSDQDNYLMPLAVRVTLTLRTADANGTTKDYQMTRTVPLPCGKIATTTS